MRDKNARPELAVAKLAARQYGAVSTRQLLAAGVGRAGISRWAAAGRLHRVHQGAYAVGHPALGLEGRWMAAVLACGRGVVDLDCGAVLSHRSAATLWGLLKPVAGAVDVSVRGYGGRARRKGIRVHRSETLPHGSTMRKGIPVTTPSRTIADLRGVVSARELRGAIREADALGLRFGPGMEPDGTRSELEFLFLELCRRHRLPPPEVNVRVGPLIVDFLWPDHRLVVETDGYRYHRGSAAFEDDHARDLELRMRGYAVTRLSYRQVTTDSKRVVAALRAEMASSR